MLTVAAGEARRDHLGSSGERSLSISRFVARGSWHWPWKTSPNEETKGDADRSIGLVVTTGRRHCHCHHWAAAASPGCTGDEAQLQSRQFEFSSCNAAALLARDTIDDKPCVKIVKLVKLVKIVKMEACFPAGPDQTGQEGQADSRGRPDGLVIQHCASKPPPTCPGY